MNEVELIYTIITHPAGFDVGCGGVIFIRKYEYDVWAVEWEEFFNPHCLNEENEVLEFKDPKLAAECFVELRKLANVGLDFDIAACKVERKETFVKGGNYYLLGHLCSGFKKKYTEIQEHEQNTLPEAGLG